MAAMNQAGRDQVFRAVRIIGSGVLALPAVSSLFASALVRDLLGMAVVAAVEVIHHEVTRRREVVKPGSAAAPPGGAS